MALFGLLDIIEIWEHECGLLYEKGRCINGALKPGRYRLWRWQHRCIKTITLQQISQTLGGQEVLTKDKVLIRVTVIAQYAVSNAFKAQHIVENYVERLHQDVQIALRDIINTRSVDEILTERTILSSELHAITAPLTKSYGITLHRVVVKDVVFPSATQRMLRKEWETHRNSVAYWS